MSPLSFHLNANTGQNRKRLSFAAFLLASRLLNLPHTGGFFSAAFVAWLLVMLVSACILEDTALHNLLFEATQGYFDVIAGFQFD